MSEWRGDVLIAGGGPVGLLLGNLLGQKGIRCAVVERRERPPATSRAIGVMPPSLDLLRRVGLDRDFVAAGVRVDTARVHDASGCLGTMRFDGLAGGYPFILSLPQAETVRLLRGGLDRFASVRYCGGQTVFKLEQPEGGVEVGTRGRDGLSVWRATVVVGCDGVRSAVRQLAGIGRRTHDYGCSFLMGDFEDASGLETEAHLFFTPHGSVESFPLPGGLRRWIVQVRPGDDERADGFLARRVLALSGHDLYDSKPAWESTFSPRRAMCSRYSVGRVVVCGDAAHVMSPIGGQGMNTGFGDAAHLAEVLAEAVEGVPMGPLLADYERVCGRAFMAAARQAERGMWLGTRTGRLWSAARGLLIRHVLLKRPVSRRVRDAFAMRTGHGR